MPTRVGDPGVFICGPEDIEPDRDVPVPAVRVAPLAVVPAHWLVLTLCDHCSPAHGGHYCNEHNSRNFWFVKTSLGRPQRREKENAPGPGVDTGDPNA
jgi:hypothetical protein